MKILAVGASGEYAGLVIPAIAARGAEVRGLIREGNDQAAVRHHGATEVVVGDLTDRKSVRRALAGVDAVFYIAPAFIADEAEVGKSFVAEVCRAGVRRLVFSSVIRRSDKGRRPNPWKKGGALARKFRTGCPKQLEEVV